MHSDACQRAQQPDLRASNGPELKGLFQYRTAALRAFSRTVPVTQRHAGDSPEPHRVIDQTYKQKCNQ